MVHRNRTVIWKELHIPSLAVLMHLIELKYIEISKTKQYPAMDLNYFMQNSKQIVLMPKCNFLK